MEKPKEIITECPFCQGKVEIITEKKELGYKGEKIEADWIVYKCKKCGEGFTTTESDTISLNNFKKIRYNYKPKE